MQDANKKDPAAARRERSLHELADKGTSAPSPLPRELGEHEDPWLRNRSRQRSQGLSRGRAEDPEEEPTERFPSQSLEDLRAMGALAESTACLAPAFWDSSATGPDPIIARWDPSAARWGSISDRPAISGQGPGRIGPYRVVDVLGQGGMGVVYLVEQVEPVERRLALKLIRSAVPDARTKALFEAERQAMARLSHPHIAQIFEAGTTEWGFPYFAMEHVEGPQIIDFCDRRRLSIEKRLRLFLDVCHGVQHAHQRGVIHRDIKPSNILVTETDGRASPKIIDFGISAALEGPFAGVEMFPRGVMAGTPIYMSPESLVGNGGAEAPDIRSDVYALGVLLYRMMTGYLPLETQEVDPLRLLGRLLADEIPPASERLAPIPSRDAEIAARHRGLSQASLRRRLSGDLDWILAKAIHAERDQRYPSVTAFAADIERHLGHEPVNAAPGRAVYRLRKFVRKYRSGVATAAVVAFALAAGVVGVGAGWVQAKAAEAEAQAQAQRALVAENRAAREAASARHVADFLVGIFEVSDPSGAQGGEVTARELLDEGADRIVQELVGEPALRATLMLTLSGVYRRLGLTQRAEPFVEEAVSIGRVTPGHALASALIERAWLRIAQGRHQEAEPALEEAFHLLGLKATEDLADPGLEVAAPLRSGALGLPSSSLGDRGPRDHGPEVQALEIEALGALVRIDIDRGGFEQAEANLRRLRPKVNRLYGPESAEAGELLLDLGRTYAYRGLSAEAERQFRASLEIRQAIYPPDHPSIGRLYGNLGLVAAEQGRSEEAVELLERSLTILRQGLGADHPNVVIALNNIGYRLFLAGRHEEAQAPLSEAVAAVEKGPLRETVYAASPLTNLGLVLWKLGRFEQAESLLLRAIEIRRRNLEPGHPHHATSLWGLANVYRDQGKFDQAERLYRQALKIRTAALAPDHGEIRAARRELAELLRRTGRSGDAAAMLASQL